MSWYIVRNCLTLNYGILFFKDLLCFTVLAWQRQRLRSGELSSRAEAQETAGNSCAYRYIQADWVPYLHQRGHGYSSPRRPFGLASTSCSGKLGTRLAGVAQRQVGESVRKKGGEEDCEDTDGLTDTASNPPDPSGRIPEGSGDRFQIMSALV